MKALSWLFLLFVTCGPALAQPDIVRVKIDRRLIDQGDTAGCGPVSLLNMLKIGPARYRKAYTAITADKDAKALTQITRKFGPDSPSKIRFGSANGIDDTNLARLYEKVAAEYDLGAVQTLYTVRKPKESNADFVKRVNAPIIHSLKQGVPVVMSIDSYGVHNSKWVKLTGHYTLITGAQALGETNPESFLIEYVDPVGAVRRQAFIYASTRRSSRAIAHYTDGDKWEENNPYLYMAAPYKNLRQSSQSEGSRHEFFLTIIFGRLSQE